MVGHTPAPIIHDFRVATGRGKCGKSVDRGGVSAYGVHQLRIAAGSVLLISESDREHAIWHGTLRLILDAGCRAQPHTILPHVLIEIRH
jgi:hypothetical protein